MDDQSRKDLEAEFGREPRYRERHFKEWPSDAKYASVDHLHFWDYVPNEDPSENPERFIEQFRKNHCLYVKMKDDLIADLRKERSFEYDYGSIYNRMYFVAVTDVHKAKDELGKLRLEYEQLEKNSKIHNVERKKADKKLKKVKKKLKENEARLRTKYTERISGLEEEKSKNSLKISELEEKVSQLQNNVSRLKSKNQKISALKMSLQQAFQNESALTATVQRLKLEIADLKKEQSNSELSAPSIPEAKDALSNEVSHASSSSSAELGSAAFDFSSSLSLHDHDDEDEVPVRVVRKRIRKAETLNKMSEQESSHSESEFLPIPGKHPTKKNRITIPPPPPVPSNFNNRTCPKCKRYFTRRASLADHINKKVCKKKSGFDCSACLKNFPSRRDLQRHERSHVTAERAQRLYLLG